MQFLFFYDEITFEQKREDPNDPKLISMLPQIVKLAEGLLQSETSYRTNALKWKDWFHCGNRKCVDKCSNDILDNKVSEIGSAIAQAHAILYELVASNKEDEKE